MKNKATRMFMQRLPDNEWVRVLERVRYQPTAGARLNGCFENSMQLKEQDPTRYMVVAGWIVGKRQESGLTMILQHYWNMDMTLGEYIDTTPFDGEPHTDYDYIADYNLLRHLVDPTTYYMTRGVWPSFCFDGRENDRFTILLDKNPPNCPDEEYDVYNQEAVDIDGFLEGNGLHLLDMPEEERFYANMRYMLKAQWHNRGWAFDDKTVEEWMEAEE